MSLWAPRERGFIGALAGVALLIHLATNGQYDFHRDELYYLDSARHPAWGYVDFPALTPSVARVSLWLFGPSIWGLRIWPSLAGAAIVLLSALIARELGGGPFARRLAALAALTSPLLLGSNWLFQTVTFDQLAWVVALYLVARLIRTDDSRLWLGVGVAVGIGLETKYTIAALAGALCIATLATPVRRQLLTPWPWLGGAVAGVILLPNLLWQAASGWPSIHYTLLHRTAQADAFGPGPFLLQQLALIGILALPLWLLGWYRLLTFPRLRQLGLTALLVFVFFAFLGKAYYPGPLHPLILAAGACWLEDRTRPGRSRWRPATAAALVAGALLTLPITVPLLPDGVMARSPVASIRKDFADTVGWHELVLQVADAYRTLPPSERINAIIVTDNYGEAGAINTEGASAGLPTALSGELSYYYWKPAHVAPGPIVAVGLDRAFLGRLFGQCSAAGEINNEFGLRNEEFGKPLTVCRLPTSTLDSAWQQLRGFQ